LPAGELPIGQVEVRGEIWKATLAPGSSSVPAGTQLTVRAVDGLTLTVAP
jgi:membrane protein implicated in regulation of membrane protease activity